jgi:hypothetical protein
MKRSVLLVVGVIAVVALAGWYFFRSGTETVAIDLFATFDTAKKQPSPETFIVGDVTIAGETAPSIQPKDPSRITWQQVTVPERGLLKVRLGVLEQGWTVAGDGVVFRVGISTGGRYDELLRLVRNPFSNPAERNWHDLTLDLSEYAGERVDIIFGTNSSLAGDNKSGDFPAWGAPRIVVE